MQNQAQALNVFNNVRARAALFGFGAAGSAALVMHFSQQLYDGIAFVAIATIVALHAFGG